jgi:hypothetical protein
VKWGSFAAWVGGLIGRIPFLPHIDGPIVTATLFASAIGVPAAYHLWESKWLARETPLPMAAPPRAVRLYQHLVNYIQSLLILTIPVTAAFVFLVAVGYTRNPLLDMPTLEIAAFDAFFNQAAVFYGYFFTFTLALAFVVALIFMKGYAKGLFTVVTLIIALQLLYYLNTPGVAEFIRDASQTTQAQHSD